MKYIHNLSLTFATLLPAGVLGFPSFESFLNADTEHAPAHQGVRATTPSADCVSRPCTFDPKDQYVDVMPGSGHEFIAPGPSDLRGPCMGLNAAANHGFIPRNGVITVDQGVQGVWGAYRMAADIAGVAFAYITLLAGDPITQKLSIGGPTPGVVNSVLGGKQPQGLSYSHHRMESDASIARSDAYLNNGDAHSLNMTKFEHLYDLANSDYTFDTFTQHFYWNEQDSVSNNPYFFVSPLAIVIGPVAGSFAFNCFANHSAERPEGFLASEVLKSFWAISGEPGNFKWNKGQERIPLNWYRRPTVSPYILAHGQLDASSVYRNNPGSFKFGGNTGTGNSFTGIDVANLTGGVYNTQTLLDGDNLACFITQVQNIVIPDYVSSVFGDAAPAVELLDKYVKPITDRLNCPKIEHFNANLFDTYPGANYSPTGPGQPF